MRYIMATILSLLITTANAADFVIQSPGISHNKRIPTLYTCDGKNISPELNWKNAPINTKSFSLILFCPDAPISLFYNWVLYNIPPTVAKLARSDTENLPDGILVGNNSMGDAIYRGPCPPDSQLHHYIFALYALDIILDLPQGAEVDEVYNEMKNHVLGEANLVGLYSH